MENTRIQNGWDAYSSDEHKIGRIKETHADYLLVEKGLLFKKDMYVPVSAVAHTDPLNSSVHLNVFKDQLDDMMWDQPPSAGGLAAGSRREDTQTSEMHLRQEELQAARRQTESGEVEVGKRVVSEQQTLDVPVTHDEVQIERHAVDRRPASGTIGDDEGSIRVPLRKEEVDVTKRPVVTEEIEVHKTPVTENQRVSETVRREEAVVNNSGLEAGSRVAPSGESVHEHRFVNGYCASCNAPEPREL